MKSTEFIESKYLNAKTAEKMNGQTYKIYEVRAEVVGQDEKAKRKMVIGFEGIEKTLVVNKTNNEILTEAFGDETDTWVGEDVIVHLVFVSFKGERTLSIQLEPVTRLKPGIQTDAYPEETGDTMPLAEAAEILDITGDTTTSPPLGSAEEHVKAKKGKARR